MKRILISIALLVGLAACSEPGKSGTAVPAAKPALTVTTVRPELQDWPRVLKASGNIAAWQETVIGPEISNVRITEVRVNVGDVVKRGQVLARIAPDAVETEFAEMHASVTEAEATLMEARANHERARQLREKGFFSPQQITQTQTATETALARLNAAKARLQSAELRRSKATVLAPDDGIISARNATVGTLAQPGQELFRLIRGGRLEWRAEVAAADLLRLAPGQAVQLTSPGGERLDGTVRAVAPTVDPQTHTALVYVDLPVVASRLVTAGMFARGEFKLGHQPALTLPQGAVLLREGFSYVFRLENGKVVQTKVTTGRRLGERVEVEGVAAETPVVAGGVGFLTDGDTVRVVTSEVAGKP